MRSNCYMMNKKSELITLMEQVGTATLWLTFRLPNHLWEDFEILISNKPKTILLLILTKITNFRPVLMVTEYTTVKRIPFRNSTHPMQTFGFYLAVDYCGEILKRVPPP